MTRDADGGTSDPFQDRLAAVGAMTVDTEHLQNVSAYLSQLAQGVENDLLSRLDLAHDLATLSSGSSGGASTQPSPRSALGATDGDFAEAQHLATNEQGSYVAIHESLKAIAKDLEDLAKAIQTISDKYQTVDQRNGLGVDALTQALGTGD